jgi:NagD protein
MDMDERLRKIRHVALDMDGTIYLGERLFEGTPGFLKLMAALGIGVSFLTNNSSHSRAEYLARLRRMGLEVTPEQVRTSTMATAEYLKLHYPEQRRLFMLGTPSMCAELEELGFEQWREEQEGRGGEPELVVVGFDRTLTYQRLCQAAWWVSRGKPFVATHPDRVCPTDLPTVLVDCGSICAAIEHATGRSPIVIGKPNPRMLEGLRARYGLQPEELAMVGDRLSTDIALALASGALGVLVLTGEATRRQAEESAWRPDMIVQDLAELADKFGATRVR